MQMKMDQWAAFFGGSYQGWMRPPSGQWEDLIGAVKFECAEEVEGVLQVTITTLEFGAWHGRMQLGNMVLEGSTDQADVYFKCAFSEIKSRFEGAVYDSPGKPLFEFQFVRSPN